jgi:hypothetical protein
MGSFVVDLLGQVRARDMPSMFADHVLEEAGPRVARLKDALETQGELLDLVTLAHGPHSLFLRANEDMILCVLVHQNVSAPSLRMGTSLVLKRLPSELAAAPSPVSKTTELDGGASALDAVASQPALRLSETPAAPELAPGGDAAAPAPQKAAPKFQRFFRGRLIEED